MAEAGNATTGVIRLDRVGAVGRVIPGAVSGTGNAQAWRSWMAACEQWVGDPNVYGCLTRWVGSGPVRDPETEAGLEETADLYRLIWTIDRFSKPNVALIDSPIGWADFCLVRHGTHKVVGERFRLSFATAAGHLLDAGASWWLARIPGGHGIDLARNGAVMDGADALALGLATHRVAAASFAAIEAAYAEAEPIDQVLDGLPVLEGGGTLANPVKSGHSPDDGRLRIVADLASGARGLSLKATLERDFAIATALAEGRDWTTWPACLDRAATLLALKPPPGVPEALG